MWAFVSERMNELNDCFGMGLLPGAKKAKGTLVGHPMEKTTFQREEDLLSTLEVLEQYYSPESPKYKFQHMFYNMQSAEDPKCLPCIPVLVRGHAELNNRISQQNAAVIKLDEAFKALETQLNHLVAKAEILRAKVGLCVQESRKLFSMHGDLEEVFRLKRRMLFRLRSPVSIDTEKRDEVVQVLQCFRELLLRLRDEVEKRSANTSLQ